MLSGRFKRCKKKGKKRTSFRSTTSRKNDKRRIRVDTTLFGNSFSVVNIIPFLLKCSSGSHSFGWTWG